VKNLNLIAGIILIVVVVLGLGSKHQKDPEQVLALSARLPAAVAPKSIATSDKANAPASLSVAAKDEDRAKAALLEIKRLRSCFVADNCVASNPSDPRESSFTAAKSIASQLRILREIRKNDRAQDFSQTARDALEFPDDFVREAALELLLEHEDSELNRSAIMNAAEDTISARFLEETLPVLHRYHENGFASAVDQALQRIIGSGPLDCGDLAAKASVDFINSQSYAEYLRVAQSLPANSRARLNLQAAIDEFEHHMNP
jgi:hypothetical protein